MLLMVFFFKSGQVFLGFLGLITILSLYLGMAELDLKLQSHPTKYLLDISHWMS
jgi:hypothetical protein